MAIQTAEETRPKYLRVKVIDNAKEGHPVVNVRVPIRVVQFGVKMAQTFAPDVKKMNLDWDAIRAIIEEGATGELVHVEDEAEHKVVDVFVE
ncbi:MAG TPA: hypothetical protein VKF14_11815 [Candidatus Dormibacteraeota bacterium]|nr:hypothetical protein [Candidatus Dormibacteraeota bacterium]